MSVIFRSLAAHPLVQHVTGAMHCHMLDVTITRDISSFIQGTPATVNPCLCDANGNQCDDHLNIKVTLNCSEPQNHENDISFRSLHDVSLGKGCTMVYMWHYRLHCWF